MNMQTGIVRFTGGQTSSELESFALITKANNANIPGDGGLPCKKDGGARRILKRTPKRYKEPVLWTWHEIFFTLKVTANLFGLEFCKILQSNHKIAHYICFLVKKKLFENVFFLRSYCKFCVFRV